MADDNWKDRLGFEINVYSSEEDERLNITDEFSPISPVSGEGYGGMMDAIIRDYDEYGTTPPRTRILRRNRDRNRKGKEGQSIPKAFSKSSPRVTYAGRNSLDKNMYKRADPSPNDTTDVISNGGDSKRSSNANKRSMQRLRGSERDLKLDLSNVRTGSSKEERAESLPQQPVLKVQSCNRFMSLSSKLVACQHFGFMRSHFQPQTTEECSQSRVEFYQTFSLLIKMGNVEKQGEVTCKRQLSKEEHLWQSELKEVIWLELQAWHAGRTLKEQDDHLFESRKNVEQVLHDIINYRRSKL
uniref:Mitogen-activated protein kinase kinase kinase N-terminal domain-containing protein n=1 Tax=Clastoptera arizonana TaxID=38151 RepID=A0A1B6CZG1_9HEMI